MSRVNSRKRNRLGNCVVALLSCYACLPSSAKPIEAVISEFIDEGKILGAQLLVGSGDHIVLERVFGVRSAVDDTRVNSRTQFCIGSCSKPYASATTLILAQERRIHLDTPIDQWMPLYSDSQIKDGNFASRAPSLRELLAHRGGIYSQKRGMNPRQSRWIRDFRLTLEESTDGIAREPLIFDPGTEYAYSGAGYCLVGRIAEVACSQNFEDLFQRVLAEPLGLKRTTYFPDAAELNIATGSLDGRPHPATPHLVRPLRLPLVGGSLYSTARDTSRFIRMLLERGRFGDKVVLTSETCQTFLSLPFEGQPYGLGWSIRMENRRPVEVSHSGSLASSRATIRINLERGTYAIVFYTLMDPSVSADAVRIVNRAIIATLSDLE